VEEEHVETIQTSAEKHTDIQALARQIEAHIAQEWQGILEKRRAKLADAYARAGDMAYGTFLDLLFRPIHRDLRQAGLKLKPKLPGDFEISREWGNADESDQQRWMWSTVYAADRDPIGTIVIITFHDHTQFRVPRQPQVIGLTQIGKEAVVEELSRRSADFAQALEFTLEYAEYLKSQEAEASGE
jgi:hypothetical protein